MVLCRLSMTISAPCCMAVSCPSMKFRCAPCASSTMRYIPYLCTIPAMVLISDMTPSYVGDVIITALGFLPSATNSLRASSSLSGDMSPSMSVLSDISRSSSSPGAIISDISQSSSPSSDIPFDIAPTSF